MTYYLGAVKNEARVVENAGRGRAAGAAAGEEDVDGVESDGEEVVEKQQRLGCESRQKADRALNTLATELEIAEATFTQDFKFGIYCQ